MPVATILKMPYIVRAAVLTGIFALVIVGFLAIRVVVNHQGLDSNQSAVVTSATDSSKDLETHYQAKKEEILAVYVHDARTDDPDLSALTTQTQDKLLALKVPASQRDAHLALVLDFDAIKIAINEHNSASVAAALSAIADSVKANP